MKRSRGAAREAVLTARTIVAKNTIPAAAAIQRASEVSAALGFPAAGQGSGRGAKCLVRVFTATADWRITTGRTAQQRSEINPPGRRKHP